MKQRLPECQRIETAFLIREVEIVGIARWNEKGIALCQPDRALPLVVLYHAPGHIAKLIIIVVMLLPVLGGFPRNINMILSLSCTKIVSCDQFRHGCAS